MNHLYVATVFHAAEVVKMADPGDRISGISQRVSNGMLYRADSQWLLSKIAELEVKLAEAEGKVSLLPSGSVETTGDDGNAAC